MGIAVFRSPDMDQGMMDDTQDLTKMNEQMCGVTAEHRVHEPPSNDQHDQDEHIDRLRCCVEKDSIKLEQYKGIRGIAQRSCNGGGNGCSLRQLVLVDWLHALCCQVTILFLQV